MSLAGPVMPGPGDLIDWRLRVAVVHLKASVVQLVEEAMDLAQVVELVE